jgi:thiosulfate dehydrogenase
MRPILLIAIVIGAFIAGCVDSKETRSGSSSAVNQVEPTRLDALFSHPSPDSIPGGQRGEQIRLGYQLVVHTQEFAAPYVGNRLTCANCHLDAGLDPNSSSFVGLSRAYPEYRARTGRVVTLADRINECFERSLNGKPIPSDSHKLRAIVDYIEWLSKDVPAGSRMAWRGIPRIQAPKPPDATNGAKVFTSRCAFCHGADGQGTMAAPAVPSSNRICLAPGDGPCLIRMPMTSRHISTPSHARIFPTKAMTGRREENRRMHPIECVKRSA